SELHRGFTPLFRPNTPDAYKEQTREQLHQRFDWLDKQMAGKDYLVGNKFSIADAYMYVVLSWAAAVKMDLSRWPNLAASVARVGAGPALKKAIELEQAAK